MDSPQGDEVDGAGVAVPSAGAGPDRDAVSAVRIGVLVPLTRPGWVEAGQHLLAGIEWGADSVNGSGGIDGRPLELVVRDTAADPGRAEAAVDELAGLGVAAL
ncbi:ABC transporter substrate-binding protein, partial [Streptomyces griseorubiginosus]